MAKDDPDNQAVDLKALLDNLPLGIWKQRLDGRLEFVNVAFCKATGISEAQFLSANHYRELYPSYVSAQCEASDNAAYASAEPVVSYEWIPFVDQQNHLLETTKFRLTDAEGHITGLIGFSQDVTEAKRIEEENLRIKQYLEDAQEMANMGNWSYDAVEDELWCSRQIYRIFGWQPEETSPSFQQYMNAVHPDDRQNVKAAYSDSIHFNRPLRMTCRIVRPNGEIAHIEQRTTHFVDEAERVVRSIGTVMDISDREELTYIAFHDPLTGLANRKLFEEQLCLTRFHAQREKTKFAVLFCDLDKFKSINDQYGHKYGDEVLIYTAEQLKTHVRKGDVVSRWGGDEFVILLGNIHSIADCKSIAENLVNLFCQLTRFKDVELDLGISIGISIYPQHGTMVDELLQSADKALYQAKSKGRGQYVLLPH